MQGNITDGLVIASAPPQQKFGDFHTRRKSLAMVRATDRRAVIRGMLAKFASGDGYGSWDSTDYDAIMEKVTLGKGDLPPVAAIVQGKFAAKKEALRELHKQSTTAYMVKRQVSHKAAKGTVVRGEKAAEAVGVAGLLS